MSARALGRGLLAPAVVAAAGLFAYWSLLDYDPYAGIQGVPDETEEFFFSPSGSSPLLIAVVTGWLVFNRRYRIRDAVGQPALLLPSALFLSLAGGFYLWANYVHAADLLIVSLIWMVLGAGALLGGAAGLRALWLPGLFMLLLIPLPAVLLNELLWPLQLVTAKIAAWIVSVIGIPTVRIGDQILTQSRIFQVIESCSGLRSIETLAMSGVLYAELFYRSRLQAALIVVSGPLIGFLVNQVRVVSLILNPYSNFAAVHTAQGIAMLVGGVLLLAVVDWLLGRVLPAVPPEAPESREVPPRQNANPRLAGLVLLLVALGVTSLSLPAWKLDEAVPGPPLFAFPSQVEEWRVAEGLPLDREFMGTTGFTEWLHRRYERGTEPVDVFVGSDRRLSRRASMRSDKTAVPGSGWRVESRRPVEIPTDGLEVEELVMVSRSERRLAYHWREGAGDLPSELVRSALALDQSPFRRSGRAIVYRLSTPLSSGEEGRAAAEARLQEWARELRAFYRPSP